MRPSVDVDGGELYECFDCCERADAPETRECDRCGGELVRIGKPRDL